MHLFLILVAAGLVLSAIQAPGVARDMVGRFVGGILIGVLILVALIAYGHFASSTTTSSLPAGKFRSVDQAVRGLSYCDRNPC